MSSFSQNESGLRDKVQRNSLLDQTILISRRLPQARAYFRRVSREGECFRLPRLDSIRANACGWTPIRAATSACVSRASLRAFNNTSKAENSSSRRSYAALKDGSSIHSFLVCSTSRLTGEYRSSSATVFFLSMFHLVQSLSGDRQLVLRSFLRFFDKSVQDDNFPVDQHTVENPSNSFWPLCPDLEQSPSHSTGIRQTEIGSGGNHSFKNPDKTGANSGRPGPNSFFDVFAVIDDRIFHATNINMRVYIWQGTLSLDTFPIFPARYGAGAENTKVGGPRPERTADFFVPSPFSFLLSALSCRACDEYKTRKGNKSAVPTTVFSARRQLLASSHRLKIDSRRHP